MLLVGWTDGAKLAVFLSALPCSMRVPEKTLPEKVDAAPVAESADKIAAPPREASAPSRRMQSPARIIIVEDHPDLLEGLRLTLEQSGGFQCCAALTALPQNLRSLALLQPDLVLMDIHLGGVNALDLLTDIRGLLPNVRLALLTGDADAQLVHRAVAAGADGYVIKGLPRDALIGSLNSILRGSSVLCPQAMNGLFQFLRVPLALEASPDLTPREREILELLLQASRAKQIAVKMHISSETVRTHIRSIYRKLEVSTRSELILRVGPRSPLRPTASRA